MGAGAKLFFALAIAITAQAAHADDKRTRSHVSSKPISHLCVDPTSLAEADCKATFDAALQAGPQTEEVVVSAASLGTPSTGHFKGAQPLQFPKRAPWVRRLERLGKEGIPFTRMKSGPDSEVVVGINRKGVLGFQMKRIASR